MGEMSLPKTLLFVKFSSDPLSAVEPEFHDQKAVRRDRPETPMRISIAAPILGLGLAFTGFLWRTRLWRT